MRERKTGRFIPFAIRNTSRETIQGVIREYVEAGTTIITDEHAAYRGLDKLGYQHLVINHSQGEYVKGSNVTTNGIESMFRLKYRRKDELY